MQKVPYLAFHAGWHPLFTERKPERSRAWTCDEPERHWAFGEAVSGGIFCGEFLRRTLWNCAATRNFMSKSITESGVTSVKSACMATEQSEKE